MEEIVESLKQNKLSSEEKANTPIETYMKILIFIFPGTHSFFYEKRLDIDGYYRQSKEIWQWTLFGIGFYLG